MERVSRIVDALKTFSHPRTEPEWLDLNDLIDKTLVVVSNEVKYVADTGHAARQSQAALRVRR